MSATDPAGGPQPSVPQRIPDDVLAQDLAAAQPMSVADAVRGEAAGGPVKLVGRGVTEGTAPLIAPLSGQPCLWYRSLVIRESLWGNNRNGGTMVPLPTVAPSDLEYLVVPMNGTDVSSTRPFAVVDPEPVAPGGAGGAADVEPGSRPPSLWVAPARCDVDSGHLSVNEVVRAAGSFLGMGRELRVEWIVPVGAPLLLVGTAARAGDGADAAWLVTPSPRVPLVSTKDERYVVARVNAAVAFRRQWASPVLVGVLTGAAALVVLVVVVLATVLVG